MFRVFFVEKMDETEISKEIALPHFRMFVDTDSMRNTKRQLLCQIKEKLVTNERTNERTDRPEFIGPYHQRGRLKKLQSMSIL